jgi:outer membrane receptor protein involved in Fe transport
VERHKGIETSLAGEILPGLNVVVGYVYQQPTVSGEAVRAGLIGADPVGQMRRTGRVNLDYRFPKAPAFSVEAGLVYTGGRAVSTTIFPQLDGKQLHVADATLLNLGMRYRFKIRGASSILRLQALNVFDAQRWLAQTTGGMTLTPPRRFAATLTTDF